MQINVGAPISVTVNSSDAHVLSASADVRRLRAGHPTKALTLTRFTDPTNRVPDVASLSLSWALPGRSRQDVPHAQVHVLAAQRPRRVALDV